MTRVVDRVNALPRHSVSGKGGTSSIHPHHDHYSSPSRKMVPPPPPPGAPQTATAAHGSDPWSDDTWGENPMNVTVDTLETDVFEFATEEVSSGERDDQDDHHRHHRRHGHTPEDVEFSLFHGKHAPSATTTTTVSQSKRTAATVANNHHHHQQKHHAPPPPPLVEVTFHEQLSATYDDMSNNPAATEAPCQLQGTVHVRSVADLSRHPFCLVLRDVHQHLDVLEERSVVAKDVSAAVARPNATSSGHRSDRVLRISLPSTAARKQVQVARYICTPEVRPVPLLVKSRVQSSGIHSRVGFKIRANPTNAGPLQRIVIMLAIPPHVNGRSGKLSRKGGLWDELKRTVSWTIPEMSPGEAIEIQAQFETHMAGSTMVDTSTASGSGPTPKFPILVRCDYRSLLSSVELKMDAYHDALSKPILVDLEKSARILHRKV